MALKPFLMGAEVEYSMSSRTARTDRRLVSRRPSLHHWLLDGIRAHHATLPDASTPSGIYLDNGGRYYLDAGNHNEYSSPEVSTPTQVAQYDRAGERILLSAIDVLKNRPKRVDVCVTKNNVNFSRPTQAAWGQHEAYTCWIPLERAAEQLIPHLVSRLPYAGAGFLSASRRGGGFELSQRARHMTRLTGRETTHDRAIFCTRAWKRSDISEAGWTRTNLICKDSQRCSFGMYLTYGVTGLLFRIMNEGQRIGKRAQLKAPVAAMRAFSLDPWLKATAPLANGKLVTALDIQMMYLREAKKYVDSGDFPSWCVDVWEHWSETLDALHDNPRRMARRLDPYLKLTIFERQLNRVGMDWPNFHRSLRVLDRLRQSAPDSVVLAMVNENDANLEGEALKLLRVLRDDREVADVGLESLRFVIRLQALELNYHELGGLFDHMLAGGAIDSVVVDEESALHAVHHPPPGGRAESRGECIREFQGHPWRCDWQFVMNDEEKKWVDMRDPFSPNREITEVSHAF